MNETYYSVEQISEMLHIHPKTVQRYIREGKLRAAKLGKSWRVTGHDLTPLTPITIIQPFTLCSSSQKVRLELRYMET